MKIKLYALLSGLLIISAAKAQIIETTPYEFSVGASGGTTFSSVSFSPKVTQGMRMGTTFGVTGRMTMGKYVGVQIELNYAQQGWDEDFESDDENISEEEREKLAGYKYSRLLNYLQLPVYSHFQFGEKNVKGFINVGPQIGYLLSESTSENLNGATPGKVNEQHNMPVEKKFEWGISGGAGIEIRTGIGYFLLEGRYLYSLGDIYSTKRKDYFTKASGQTITAKISYLIPLK